MPKIPLIPLPTQVHQFIINPCISMEHVSDLIHFLEKNASSNSVENDCWSISVSPISFPLEVHFHIASSALLVFAIRGRTSDPAWPFLHSCSQHCILILCLDYSINQLQRIWGFKCLKKGKMMSLIVLRWNHLKKA